MDGENNGKPYEQMDGLGGFPIIFGSTPIYIYTWSPSGKNPSSDLISDCHNPRIPQGTRGFWLKHLWFLPFKDLKTSVLFKQKSGIFQYVFLYNNESDSYLGVPLFFTPNHRDPTHQFTI